MEKYEKFSRGDWARPFALGPPWPPGAGSKSGGKTAFSKAMYRLPARAERGEREAQGIALASKDESKDASTKNKVCFETEQ